MKLLLATFVFAKKLVVVSLCFFLYIFLCAYAKFPRDPDKAA